MAATSSASMNRSKSSLVGPRTADISQSAVDDTGETENSNPVELRHGRKLHLPHRSRGVGGDGKIGDPNHLLPVDDPLGVDDHGDEHTVP